MKCTKNDFLKIYMESNIKDLQAEIDSNFTTKTNYTPNIDFLNKIWNAYNGSKCRAFDVSLKEIELLLPKLDKDSAGYKLQLERYDFLDKLKFTCSCDEDINSNIKKNKIIKSVDFDKSSIPASGETRVFKITGDKNAVFSMYITNEDSPKKYYNFEDNNFTTTRKF